jgi:hypothetical protein
VKISKLVVLYFEIVLLYFVLCTVVALSCVRLAEVVLLQSLLDVVFCVDCLFSLLTLHTLLFLNLDSDLVRSEAFESFLFG